MMNQSLKRSCAVREGTLASIIKRSVHGDQLSHMESMAGGVLESEGFAVYSDVKFLYLIGKIASETGQYPEEGLGALNDYMTILEYFKDDMLEEGYERLRLKSLYLIGMLFYKLKDYE